MSIEATLNYSLLLIIIIIFVYCNWVVTRWQWLFYLYTKHEIEIIHSLSHGFFFFQTCTDLMKSFDIKSIFFPLVIYIFFISSLFKLS